MTRKSVTWTVAALFIASLAGFGYYFFGRGKASAKKEPERAQQATTLVDVTHDAVGDPDMSIGMTPSTNTSENRQPEPAAPRIVRVVSKEEITASFAHYVEPLEKPNIQKISASKAIKPGEFINVSWQSIYLSEANDYAETLNWPLLWEVGMPSEFLEIRIWMYGNFISVYRLVRHGDEWIGFYANKNEVSTVMPILALTPRSGWPNLWMKLENQGILIMPDSDTLPNVKRFLDGTGYIVEINNGGRYRSYQYNDLDQQEFPEAKQMNEIIKTLREEFQ